MTGVLHMMVGSGGLALAMTDAAIGDAEVTTPSPSCSVSMNRDGTITFTGNASDADPTDEYVVNPVGNPGDGFEARLSVTSGDAPNAGDTVNAWLALTSDRTWTRAGAASAAGVWLIELRPPSGSVVESASFTMTNTFTP